MDREEQPLTNHQAKYCAYLFTKRGGEGVERLSQSLFDASVEGELFNIKARIRALERGSRLAQTVNQQREYEEQIKRLGSLKKRKRAERTRLFVIEWELV